MNDELLVGVLDGIAEAKEKGDTIAQFEGGGVFSDGTPLYQFHGQPGETGGSGAGVEEAGDAGMLEGGEDLFLTLEAFPSGG